MATAAQLSENSHQGFDGIKAGLCLASMKAKPNNATGMPGVFMAERHRIALCYHRARYYDPQARRFISEDPIGLEGGINLYAYVGNNPINIMDPMGLDDPKMARPLGLRQGILEGVGGRPEPPPGSIECESKIYVGLGKSSDIGTPQAYPHSKIDGVGGLVEKNSAAVIPSQFGVTPKQLRPIVDQISGITYMGPRWNTTIVTFDKVRDVVDNDPIYDPVAKKWFTGDYKEAQRIIKARHPGTIVIELPGLKSYPGKTKTYTPPEVYFGIIYVPIGTSCPIP
jgi:RHS repeat-associated protein